MVRILTRFFALTTQFNIWFILLFIDLDLFGYNNWPYFVGTRIFVGLLLGVRIKCD